MFTYQSLAGQPGGQQLHHFTQLLSRELAEMEDEVMLLPAEVAVRRRVLDVLRRLFEHLAGPEVVLHVHGSFEVGLSVPGSDVDVVVSGFGPKIGTWDVMNALANVFDPAIVKRTTHGGAPAATSSATAVGKALTSVDESSTASQALVPGGVAASDRRSATPPPPSAQIGDASIGKGLTDDPTTTANTAAASDALPAIFQEARAAFSSVTVISNVRVPIIKLVESSTGVGIDIAIGGGQPHAAKEFILNVMRRYPVVAKRVILFLKVLVRGDNLGEGQRGGISSFALHLLVTHFLNMRAAEIVGLIEQQSRAVLMAHHQQQQAALWYYYQQQQYHAMLQAAVATTPLTYTTAQGSAMDNTSSPTEEVAPGASTVALGMESEGGGGSWEHRDASAGGEATVETESPAAAVSVDDRHDHIGV